ncbi:MAG TPA: hypothetical protein VGD10_04300 [Allosphingosinicella sp.]|uniref:CC0125/CC1285 family lipoprotein n=1 Tax=Allosphingosinicella sp. TaxID=2823234 RepID=UPI002ED94D09
MSLRENGARAGLLAVAAALAISVVGCSTPTPYQPEVRGQRVSGGYSEVQLAEDRFRVNFHGNTLTSRDRVEGYMLYRAAELTVQNGYDWFLIVDRHTEHDVETYARPGPFYRPYYGPNYGWWRPHWSYYRRGLGWEIWHPEYGDPFWRDRIDIETVEHFEANAEIVMKKGTIPTGEERAFDARKVMQDLEPTIERPKPTKR